MNKGSVEGIKVSIIIPIYNAEKYLRKCLDSVVSQTLKEKEVIVIDDGSNDSSASIVDEYAAKYEFVHAYHQDNMGVVKSRCKALKLARGEFVGWVDSDDFIENNMFERLYNSAKEIGADVAYCDYDFYPAQIKTKKNWFKPYTGQERDWRFIERNTQQWNKIVSRRLLIDLRMSYWMEHCGEGAYAFVLIKANKIVTVNEQLYHYRVGHTSLSNNMHKTEWYEENVDKTKKQLEASVILTKGWNEYFTYRVIYALLQVMLIAACNADKKIYYTNRRKLKKFNPKSNRYVKVILDNNHGKMRSFVLRKVIPIDYRIARFVGRIALKN
ncbi:glycosyltransferase (plasmid) [Lactiplantibacillus plantarum]|uniref:glycosyltransferase family 2 protein n=1 Tax=Lactobacillaceae TaxID=33958 RepID=UPI000F7B5CE1|nr:MULTISPECIES: glycosyltransferase family 2 protein [Lactobacillaceae]QBA72872.1 glycosyltransferase [Lactiplantibacillus plantarum]